METLDIIDRDDNVIAIATKAEMQQKGLWSRVSFIILINSNDEIYLQQRKATKKKYPLYWSGSAAGHVQSGESYHLAAVRELEEELGIVTELVEVGKFSSEDDKEIVTIFIGSNDGPYILEEAAIEKAESFSFARLKLEISTMKVTSYVVAAIPMVERYLHLRK